jgi:regulator of PEP synthase PpsR (kinase-PPPase family)
MAERRRASIHVLSDSLGETGEMVALAAAAQFEPGAFRIERLSRVDDAQQLRDIVVSHCGAHCIFLYTLVDRSLCAEMERLVSERGVNAVDLLGPAVDLIARVSGYEPTHEAGAVRRTDAGYFERVEAMEFAVKHDDGRNPEGLLEADMVLIGVSRTSKTPLSMYLAFKGYRIANIPLAKGSAPPHELFDVDRRKLFGLVSSADTLMEIRTMRMKELGGYVPGYADREQIERELEQARALMRQLGCIIINTDGRAIEETAQEILRYAGAVVETGD